MLLLLLVHKILFLGKLIVNFEKIISYYKIQITYLPSDLITIKRLQILLWGTCFIQTTLPIKYFRYLVLRSPTVNKNSREQYGQIYKRMCVFLPLLDKQKNFVETQLSNFAVLNADIKISYVCRSKFF